MSSGHGAAWFLLPVIKALGGILLLWKLGSRMWMRRRVGQPDAPTRFLEAGASIWAPRNGPWPPLMAWPRSWRRCLESSASRSEWRQSRQCDCWGDMVWLYLPWFQACATLFWKCCRRIHPPRWKPPESCLRGLSSFFWSHRGALAPQPLSGRTSGSGPEPAGWKPARPVGKLAHGSRI